MTWNRQPPAMLVTPMVPSWDSTTPRAIASPGRRRRWRIHRRGSRAPADVEDAGQVRPRGSRRSRRSPPVGPPRRRRGSRQLHRSLGFGMTDRVVDQVRHRSGQLVRGALYREPVVVRRRAPERTPPAPARARRLPRHVLCELPHRDRVRGGGPPRRSRDSSNRSSTSPVIRSTVVRICRNAPGTSSITPSSRPSETARNPASGVRRSWDMKATSSRRLLRGPARVRGTRPASSASSPARP